MPKTVELAGPDHPITIEHTPSLVAVRAGGLPLASSRRAVTLREAAYPPVQYLPLEDIDTSLLRRSATTTYCPYKGDCSYFDVVLPDGSELADVAWTYERPYPAVGRIAGHLAFYTDKVEVVLLEGGTGS